MRLSVWKLGCFFFKLKFIHWFYKRFGNLTFPPTVKLHATKRQELYTKSLAQTVQTYICTCRYIVPVLGRGFCLMCKFWVCVCVVSSSHFCKYVHCFPLFNHLTLYVLGSKICSLHYKFYWRFYYLFYFWKHMFYKYKEASKQHLFIPLHVLL